MPRAKKSPSRARRTRDVPPAPPAPRPDALAETTPGAPPRLVEVLEAGLELIAQRGVAGASLRELARRLGMSQPSLYHYFQTKDELVSLIVQHFGGRMTEPPPSLMPPTDPAELPRWAVATTLNLWETPRHAAFVRFMFVVSIERPEYRERIRELFVTRIDVAFAMLGELYAPAAGMSKDEVRWLLRMIVSAVGLPLIEERALFGYDTPSRELLAYADFVARSAEDVLRARG